MRAPVAVRLSPLLALVALLAALSTPTVADDAPSLAAALPAALKEAERLAGERVLLREDEGEALVLRVARVGDGRLRCEAELVALGGMRSERTLAAAEVDATTGGTRALSALVVRGAERREVEGTIEPGDGAAGVALLRVRTHRRAGGVDEQTVRSAWPADAVPWPVALCLAPLLPPRASLRLAHPLAVLTGGEIGGERHTLTREGAVVRLAPALDPGAPDAATQVVTLGDGGVVRVELPGLGRYALVDREAAARLLSPR